MSKLEAIIYLSRNGLQVFLPEENKNFQQPFTPKTIVNLEIVNPQVLVDQVNYFLETNNITPRKAIIMLSEDMLFTKKISALTPEARDDLVKEFLTNIPLDPQLVVHKVFTFRGYRLAVATNRDLFMSIKNIFESLKWKVVYVVPDVIFIKGSLAPQKIMDLLNDKELLQMGNFLNLKTSMSIQGKEKKPFPAVLVFGSLLGLALIVFVFLILFNVIDLTGNEKYEENVSISDVALVSNNVSGSAPEDVSNNETTVSNNDTNNLVENDVDFTLFNIQVLNGTGVPGLAGSTRGSLEDIGFEDIDVGNADKQDYKETQVIYKEGVPKNIIDDIVEKLNETFDKVVSEVSQESINYDVVITTGVLK